MRSSSADRDRLERGVLDVAVERARARATARLAARQISATDVTTVAMALKGTTAPQSTTR